jgi:hypothetical protein
MTDRKKIRENARKAREQQDKKTIEEYRKKSARNRVASEKEVAARSALKKETQRQRSGSTINNKKMLTEKPKPSGQSSGFNVGAYSRSKADWTSKETPNYLGDDIGKTSPVWND